MVQTDNQPYYFKTTDTSLAAYLYTEGYSIKDVEYSGPRATIIFEDSNPDILGHERLYYTGKSAVDAATYSRIHKRLSKIFRLQLPWTEGVMHG